MRRISKIGKQAIGTAAVLGVMHAKTVFAKNFLWIGSAGDANWNSDSNWYNQTAGANATTFPGNTTNQTASAVIFDTVFDYTQGYYSGTPSLPASINIPAAGIQLGEISFGDAESNGDFTLASNVSIGSPTTTITLVGVASGKILNALQRLGTGSDGVVGGVNGGSSKGLSYTPTTGTQTILSNLVANATETWPINGPTGELLVNGNISNSAAQTLSKSGGGELEIASNNSAGFLGSFVAQGGITLIDTNGSIGAGTSTVQLGDTTATNNPSLLTNSGVTFAHNVVTVTNTKGVTEVLGGGSNQTSSTWTGNISLNYPVSLTGGSTGTTTFSGTLSDGVGGTDNIGDTFNFSSSTIDKINPGTVILSASNTYSGGTNVSDGTLTGTHLSAFGSGYLIVNPTGGTGMSADAAIVNTTNSIAPTAAVTVNTNSATAVGTLNFNGTSETIGSLSGNGIVVLANTSGTSLVTGNDTSTVFSGTISDTNGTGSLTKNGSGIFTLGGSSTYGGVTNVSAGTLLVTNTAGSATGSGPVLVGASAYLGGSGNISGAVTVHGTIAPGIASLSTPTELTIGSGSVLSGTTTLDLTAPGVSDEILFGPAGSGSATFGGSLDIADTTGFTLAVGQSFTLFGFNSATGQFSPSLPVLPAGLTWNTSTLYQNGVISIVSASFSSGVWALASSGNWETGSNWIGGAFATGAGQTATFGDSIGSGLATVTLTAPETAGTISFNGSAGGSYTLTGNTLTLSNNSGPAIVSVSSGNQTISAPIVLTAGVNVTTDAGSSLTVGNTVGGSGGLTVTGGSSLIVSPTGVISAPLVVAGNVSFANNSAGSTYLVRNVSSLNLSGGTVTLATGEQATRQLLDIASANLSGSGLIDLTNNDLLLQGGGASGLQQITALIKQGYGTNGNWQGSGGITSSAAASDTTHLTALGVILNQSIANLAIPLYTTFDGSPTSEGDVLVKYTYYGDTNLDGVVDGTDYSRIDIGYVNGLSGWANGDFNYDGVVDGSDYTLIDNAFNNQGVSLASEIIEPTAEIASVTTPTVVPEPVTLGLFGIGVIALLGRRSDNSRRRRR